MEPEILGCDWVGPLVYECARDEPIGPERQELTEKTRQDMEGHLASCPACRLRLRCQNRLAQGECANPWNSWQP
jgi:hypothetical protein